MLIDGVNLAEGSNIANAVIGSGPTLPQSADKGEIFYQDGTGLFVYSGSEWTKFLSSGESTFTSPVVAPSFSGAGTNLTGTAANLNIGGNAATATTAGSATANVLKAGDTMTGALTLPGAPTQALHAATKAYVDAVAQGLDPKASVRVATTANITLSGTQTIDGVAVIAGDRVLVKNQTTGSQNGIYVVATGAWTRASDADANVKVTPGMYTFVEDGTAGAASGWNLITKAPITVGTAALVFSQFNAAASYTAGTNVTIVGNAISVPGYNIPYDVAGAVFGKPAASAVVMRFVSPRAFTIGGAPSYGGLSSANGLRASSATNATASAVFSILKNGALIGKFNFQAGTNTALQDGTATGNNPVSIVAGDVITVTAPTSVDATLADIQFTIVGALT